MAVGEHVELNAGEATQPNQAPGRRPGHCLLRLSAFRQLLRPAQLTSINHSSRRGRATRSSMKMRGSFVFCSGVYCVRAISMSH